MSWATAKWTVDSIVQNVNKALNIWTSTETQLNGAVVFDNLNPDYGYDLYLYHTANGIVPNVYPIQTVQATGTQTGTIKLTYTISGGVDGSTQFKLRVNKQEEKK